MNPLGDVQFVPSDLRISGIVTDGEEERFVFPIKVLEVKMKAPALQRRIVSSASLECPDCCGHLFQTVQRGTLIFAQCVRCEVVDEEPSWAGA